MFSKEVQEAILKQDKFVYQRPCCFPAGKTECHKKIKESLGNLHLTFSTRLGIGIWRPKITGRATDRIAVSGPFCFRFPTNDELYRAFLIPFRPPRARSLTLLPSCGYVPCNGEERNKKQKERQSRVNKVPPLYKTWTCPCVLRVHKLKYRNNSPNIGGKI